MDWIIKFIKNYKCNSVDILNTDFIDAYMENCNPKRIDYQPFGANKVPELGSILSEMYHSNMLERGTIGLPRCEDGFPKWVYTYWLK